MLAATVRWGVRRNQHRYQDVTERSPMRGAATGKPRRSTRRGEMGSRTIRWAVVLAALAFLAGAVMVAGVARAPQRAGAATTPALGGPAPGAALDHFVCYH